MPIPTSVTFVVYFIFLLSIGFYFYRKSASIEDYLLGGRGMGAWVTALSAQASDMSGWLLMGIVAYAWGGFGAAFGPLVLFGLFSRRTSWQAALAGMATGTVILVVWKQIGLGKHMYEIVPGFISNCLVIFFVSAFVGQKDRRVLRQYDEVIRVIGAGK